MGQPVAGNRRIYARSSWDRMECGQVRRDLKTGGQLVELVMGHLKPGIGHVVESWTVSDLLTGEEYERRVEEIGVETFNAMEVIAWATDQG